MKIALTASGADLDSKIEARFGRCPFFLIVDTETMEYEALENPNIALGGGAGIQSAQLMAEKEVATVLTGNCGPNAFQVFGTAGIQVIVGVSGVVRDAVKQFKSGAFPAATSPNVASHFGMGAASSPAGEPNNTTGDIMGRGSGFGMGRGGGRGMGMGSGGGMGRGMGMGAGMGAGMPGTFQQQYPDVQQGPERPMSRDQEIAALHQQSAMLQDQMSQINDRLQQLQRETSNATLVAAVLTERCTGCARCASVCPAGAIRIVDSIARVDPNNCTGCGQCVSACPQRAITLGAR